MERRRFLQTGLAAALIGFSGCNVLSGPEDAKRASRNYRYAYFNFQEAKDEMIQAKLSAQEGRNQTFQSGLNIAIEGFNTAKGQFEAAAELTSRSPQQVAN
ncbi:MAG: hypothetical protein ABEI52_07975, partial [Halobacteriaceae archaeon]